jgi:hypothetical protein
MLSNNLKTLNITHPVIASEAYGWDPTKVLAESHEKIAWKCQNNHIWVETIFNRTTKNIKCLKCLNQNSNG